MERHLPNRQHLIQGLEVSAAVSLSRLKDAVVPVGARVRPTADRLLVRHETLVQSNNDQHIQLVVTEECAAASHHDFPSGDDSLAETLVSQCPDFTARC